MPISRFLTCCLVAFLSASATADSFSFRENERIAFVGGSTAERMNLFGHFEALLHTRFPEKRLIVRNFGWPADEAGLQQRPDNYTRIDDPMDVFHPELFVCFFGFNESFSGSSAEAIDDFRSNYRRWIEDRRERYSTEERPVRFILVSPIAFEATGNPFQPDGKAENEALRVYSDAVRDLAEELELRFVDLFSGTRRAFSADKGAQFTINGVHVNEAGDRLMASFLDAELFPDAASSVDMDSPQFDRIRYAVNDKSWLHLQDYRMLNGWYVYGGRRTWDTQTFPGEFLKIRRMVSVRDDYIHGLASGTETADAPDDTGTGDVFIPETMFGTRDDGFRRMREPKTLEYPTPEESIRQMSVPDGLEVRLFASEREFPELANPTQMTFDSKGRLWVSCMINYPQWLPGSARPGDRLLILEDTDNDGRADSCKTFYDELICPTGFEFHQDGVLVVDEPRILFLRDTDGDDKADEVTHLIDGIATDDTHHTMGAWEWSHGGLLYMQEGLAMSTTLETPYGPFRNKGPAGSYVLDPVSLRIRHFRTPGYGNPWCMVFDRWGNGIIGDGTNAQQHWTSPLSGYEVSSRRTLRPVFDNQGMRPAVGNDFLFSRHLPDDVQGQFIYACVINMHGMPRFNVRDEDGTAGMTGERVADLLSSTDMFFRPVDPQIGPDGAVWFGDWCNALIGHMQYSQRDPNRDHQHGRIYRLVNTNKPLLEPELQHDASIPELLDQLTSYELRTRYRARRELRGRDREEVLAATGKWVAGRSDPQELCEALWVQESCRQLDPQLVSRILSSDDFHARAAAVHAVSNEMLRFADARAIFADAVQDPHPRVRLEAVRALSFMQSEQALELALKVVDGPLDYWIEYTLEHTLHALKPFAQEARARGDFLVDSSEAARNYYRMYELMSGPGGKAVRPLAVAQDPDADPNEVRNAIRELAGISGGNADGGQVVYERVCSACHMIGDKGKAFGPKLDRIANQYSREELVMHVLHPNEKIAKGYETVMLVMDAGKTFTGFVIRESDEEIVLGVATQDGKGKELPLPLSDVEERVEMKASSMPEGLAKTIAPGEFLDLIEFLSRQYKFELRDGNWIVTRQTDHPLREYKGAEEITRNADLQLGPDFVPHWSREADLTLSAAAPPESGFAFHSAQPSVEPSVVIRLPHVSRVTALKMLNRPGFQDRANGLAVWVSEDGKDWEQVWKARRVRDEYIAELPEGTTARYIRVGLDGTGIFHLRQIVGFGHPVP